MGWSLSYKFLAMVHSHICQHSRLRDYLKDGAHTIDSSDVLPAFRALYEEQQNREEIGRNWGMEYKTWPRHPRFEIRHLSERTGGYVIQPDRVLLDCPSVALQETSGARVMVRRSDITRRQMDALVVAVEVALERITREPGQADAYHEHPRDYLLQTGADTALIPRGDYIVSPYSDEITIVRRDRGWTFLLPHEEAVIATPKVAAMLAARRPSPCGLGC